MIIETSDNRFYRVNETGITGLDHVWNGVEVKRARSKVNSNMVWIDRAKARPTLVRKAATRVVEA